MQPGDKNGLTATRTVFICSQEIKLVFGDQMCPQKWFKAILVSSHRELPANLSPQSLVPVAESRGF